VFGQGVVAKQIKLECCMRDYLCQNDVSWIFCAILAYVERTSGARSRTLAYDKDGI
jgi:hypothetical protein